MEQFEHLIGKLIVESDYLCVLIVDEQGLIHYSNEAFDRFIKTVEGSCIGLTLADITHENEKAAVLGALDELLRTGTLPKRRWIIRNKLEEFTSLDVESKRIEVDGKIFGVAILQDISKEKNLERKLQENNEALEQLNNQRRLLIDTAQLGIWTLHLKSGTNTWNDRLLEIYGLNRKQIEKKPDIWLDMIHPDDLEYLQKCHTLLYEGSTVQDIDFRIIRPDGETRYVRTSGTSIFDNNGQIVKMTGAYLDLTRTMKDQLEKSRQRILLEQKTKDLELSNSSLKLATQAAKLGIWNYNLQTEHLSWNDEMFRIFELAPEEFDHSMDHFSSFVLPEDGIQSKEALSKIFEGEDVFDIRFRIQTKSGLKHIVASGSPLYDDLGTLSEIHGINIDITGLVEQEEQLKNITSKLPGFVLRYRIRPDGSDGVDYVSEGISKVYGITAEQAINDVSLIWSCISEKDVLAIKESIEKSASLMEDWNQTFRIVTPNGEKKHVNGLGTPTQDEHGDIVWDTVILDITKQKDQEDQLKEQQRQREILTNQVPGMVYIYNLYSDGSDDFSYTSNGLNEIFELDDATRKPDTSLIWKMIHPEDFDLLGRSVANSAKNKTKWSCVYRIITPSGKVKHIKGSGTPQFLEDGTIRWYSIGIDITHQIEQQLEIENQRQQLLKITDNIPGVVLKYQVLEDGSYKIPYISERVAEFWGVPAHKVIENADEGWKRVVPEDIDPAKASIDNAVVTLTEWNHIMRFYDKDNTIRYLRGIGSPFKMVDGTVEFITVFIDVTDQVLAEQIIIEKQTQLKNVTDQLPGVVFKYSLSTNGTERILYLSDGVESTFGINKTDALSDVNVVWNLFHEEDLEGLKDSMFASAQTLEKWEYRFRFYSQDGEIRYLQGYGTPKKQSNGTVVWDAILLDITDRVDAETRAQTWNKKLRSFINSSPIAIYQIDPNGIVNDFWNPTASVIFGWQKHEVLGNKLPHVRADQKDEMVKIIEDIRITGKPKQFEVKRFNRFNEELVLEVTAGPFFDENGTLTDLLIIANDITELTEYRESLEKALREKEILLQEIHHRVKNNLAIVSGLLELQMMRDDYNADNGIIVEARNRIHSIAMVHEQLYQDMDFSHIDPSEYYRKLLSKLQRNTISDERDIEYDLKFEIDRININRAVPLGLLINELFTNSIKYAFVDGKGKLKLHFQQVGNQISVHYEDDGPGFTVDDVKQKNTIGWQLIETLLLQLDSEYTMDTKEKFQLIFTFEEAIKGSQSNYT